MSDKESTRLDPIAENKLINQMKKDFANRRAFQPRFRISRPWLGALNWEKHKRKLANQRRAHNKMARQTRRAQRRAARA